jgi:hypothetical protein
MKLNKTITLYPSPYRDESNNLIVPEPIITDELDVSFILRKKTSMVYAQIVGIPGVIVLTTSTNSQNIDLLTLSDFELMLSNKLGQYPEKFLQNLFPKTMESDPDGPGSVLSSLLSYIGIKSSQNCNCKQRAIEMNEKGNDWCEKNIHTILEWLKEESQNRKLPFIESVAKLIVLKSIKISRKLKNEK